MRFLSLMSVFLVIVSCSAPAVKQQEKVEGETARVQLRYGLEADKYSTEQGEVKKGDFFGTIMEDCGVGASQVQPIIKASKDVFDLTKIRLGNRYEIFREKDSAGAAAFFVYELDNINAVVVSLKDSLYAYISRKEVVPVLKKAEVTISTSLWNDVQKAGIPAMMALKLSDVYDCTIDFFGLQSGD